VLKDLTLKKGALDLLELPIEVKEGYLKSLKVIVPWTSLSR